MTVKRRLKPVYSPFTVANIKENRPAVKLLRNLGTPILLPPSDAFTLLSQNQNNTHQ